jgi:hypothetical protein
MTLYCKTNITVVGAFLSQHKQLTPISAHECCKTRGGGRGKGLICPALTHSSNGDGDSGNGNSVTMTATVIVAAATATAVEKTTIN